MYHATNCLAVAKVLENNFGIKWLNDYNSCLYQRSENMDMPHKDPGEQEALLSL